MAVLRSVNVALSFLLEIAMLVAFGYWGLQAVDHPVLRWVVALGLPLLVIALWARFLAPRASRRVGSKVGVPVSLALFCLAALALFGAHLPVLGAIMLALAILNRVLVIVWKQW